MTDQPKERLSAAEFLSLPETNRPLQLIDGAIIDMGSPTPDHQTVVFQTASTLNAAVKSFGGRVFVAPLDVHLDEDNVPQPDVMVILQGGRCAVGEKYLTGAPDLIVEVMSPGSVKLDRREKFRLYERHGVREYWIADPQERLIDVWTLQNDRFVLLNVYETGETFQSPLLGDIHVSDLFSI
ncbi:MAG: Uma2 family endonuclease [Anaerolineae bacterium]|nr:Uma2 family endonuclease [Anaerolineae bacterium]